MPAGRALQLRDTLIATANSPLPTRTGCSLRAEQRGQGASVVVFESGFGHGAGVWKAVVAELGDECRCIASARTGLDASGSDGTPNTIERHVRDLAAMFSMLPPALATDYKLLIAQLDSEMAVSPRTQPDLPVALLTSTQVAADPFVFEETAHGKALWKRQHAALFAGFSRGSMTSSKILA